MNFDKTNTEHDYDDDYGHFCVLEENTHVNNYVQRVYIQNNRYIIMHNYDKPSLYHVDYYYDDSLCVTIPVKLENLKNEMIQMSKPYSNNNHHKNDDHDDDDDNKKGARDKIFVMLTQMCVFSIFVSAVVIIMTMR